MSICFSKKKKLYISISEIPFDIDNLTIYSSPNELYDKDLYDFVCKGKKKHRIYKSILTDYELKYGKSLTEYVKNEIYKLHCNFITDADTELIIEDLSIF